MFPTFDATGIPRSKVKVARSRDQSEPSSPNAVPVLLDAGGGIPCRPNPAATLLALWAACCMFSRNKCIDKWSKYWLRYPTGRTTHLSVFSAYKNINVSMNECHICWGVCVYVCWQKSVNPAVLLSTYLSPPSSHKYNPDVSLAEQLPHLSYDSRWEFPKNQLKLG